MQELHLFKKINYPYKNHKDKIVRRGGIHAHFKIRYTAKIIFFSFVLQ